MTGMDHSTGMDGPVSSAAMGLLTAVVAPALAALLARGRPRARPMSAPAAVAVLAGFALLHAATMLVAVLGDVAATAHLALHVLLLGAAVGFWWPVLGPSRLEAGGRALYLFAAAPALDCAAMAVIVAGHEVDGLAMIVSMLPIAAVAVALAWRRLLDEERSADGVVDLSGGAS